MMSYIIHKIKEKELMDLRYTTVLNSVINLLMILIKNRFKQMIGYGICVLRVWKVQLNGLKLLVK